VELAVILYAALLCAAFIISIRPIDNVFSS